MPILKTDGYPAKESIEQRIRYSKFQTFSNVPNRPAHFNILPIVEHTRHKISLIKQKLDKVTLFGFAVERRLTN